MINAAMAKMRLVTPRTAPDGPALAKAAAAGKLAPTDVAKLQAFLVKTGHSVGPAGADGVLGPRTRRALAAYMAGNEPAAPRPAQDRDSVALTRRLRAGCDNRYEDVKRKCFRFAWAATATAGGEGICKAKTTRTGRGQPITHLDKLVASGHVTTGDVIYTNRQPGADPTSRDLSKGPHWFVYMGDGTFADQYGDHAKTAAQMQRFVPGRKIDTIYHPFG